MRLRHFAVAIFLPLAACAPRAPEAPSPEVLPAAPAPEGSAKPTEAQPASAVPEPPMRQERMADSLEDEAGGGPSGDGGAVQCTTAACEEACKSASPAGMAACARAHAAGCFDQQPPAGVDCSFERSEPESKIGGQKKREAPSKAMPADDADPGPAAKEDRAKEGEADDENELRTETFVD